jgi:hypothetical protein
VKVEVTASPFDRAIARMFEHATEHGIGGPAASSPVPPPPLAASHRRRERAGPKEGSPADRPSDSGLAGGTPPSFPPPAPVLSPIERVIEALVYEHLADLVDLPRLNEIERLVAMRLVELAGAGALPGVETADLADRATAIVDHAWHNLIDDPRRFAAVFDASDDDDCELCRAFDRAERDKRAGRERAGRERAGRERAGRERE